MLDPAGNRCHGLVQESLRLLVPRHRLWLASALIISVLISAVCVGMSAIFFAEFASRYPSAGGVYGYLYAVWGGILPGWVAG